MQDFRISSIDSISPSVAPTTSIKLGGEFVNEFGAKKSCKRTHELKSRGRAFKCPSMCSKKSALENYHVYQLGWIGGPNTAKNQYTHTNSQLYLNLSQQKSSPNHPSTHPQKRKKHPRPWTFDLISTYLYISMGNINLYFKVFPFVPRPVYGILLVLLFGVLEDLSRWTFEKKWGQNSHTDLQQDLHFCWWLRLNPFVTNNREIGSLPQFLAVKIKKSTLES